MRSYDLTLSLDMRAIVPEQFTQEYRKQAQAEDASPFLKQAQEQFPDDDEGFTLAVLKNGMRIGVRAAVIDLFESSGIGCHLAPAHLKQRDRTPPENAAPVTPEVVAQQIPDAAADSDQSCTQG